MKCSAAASQHLDSQYVAMSVPFVRCPSEHLENYIIYFYYNGTDFKDILKYELQMFNYLRKLVLMWLYFYINIFAKLAKYIRRFL